MTTSKSERGAVALITAVIISIFLTIIVTGLVTLMASEVRQSDDAEQSARAYYAAQSGIESGVQKVITAIAAPNVPPYPDQACTSDTSIFNGIEVGWTCQQITYSSGATTGKLSVDKPETVDLAGGHPFNRMVLSWDTPKRLAADYSNYPVGSLPGTAGVPAIELTIVSYKSGNISPKDAQDTITHQNLLVTPSLGPAGTPDVSGALNNPYNGVCNPALTVGYHCTITVNGFSPNLNYLIRIRSRYQDSDYQMQFYNGGAGPLVMPDGNATIDVTAHSGNVYRRVIYKVPITNNAAAGLDYVLFSDNNICKDYTIINTAPLTGVGYPCTSN